jgi:3-hydroxyisobutyrate dehydrogenase-like beta-hydroxyacid dehydrogenase
VTAEVMAICARAGTPPQVFFDMVSGSGAATVSNLFLELGPKMLNRDYSPLFAIDLLCKDNGLALQMASDVGAPAVISRATQMLNEIARAEGLGAEDTSALVKVYERLYGTHVSKTQPFTAEP